MDILRKPHRADYTCERNSMAMEGEIPISLDRWNILNKKFNAREEDSYIICRGSSLYNPDLVIYIQGGVVIYSPSHEDIALIHQTKEDLENLANILGLPNPSTSTKYLSKP